MEYLFDVSSTYNTHIVQHSLVRVWEGDGAEHGNKLEMENCANFKLLLCSIPRVCLCSYVNDW